MTWRGLWQRLRVPVAAPTDDRLRAGALVSRLQLRWLIYLRWIMVVVALGVLAIEHTVNPAEVRPRGLLLTILATAVTNVIWWAAAHFLLGEYRDSASSPARGLRRALRLANAQVGADLFLLTLMLHFTGGVENPMAAFYLFHMAIGSLVLERWHAMLQGVWAVALYALMGVATLRGSVPHYVFVPGVAPPQLWAQAPFVFVAIGVLACAVFGMLYFTLHIAHELDVREQALRVSNAALERSQAAIKELQGRRARFMQTAAHQLKSPLATIETLAGLIRDRVVPEDAIQPTCEKIAVRCEEGIRQVGELLALARVEEADPARHALEGTDVVQTITDLYRRYLPYAQRQRVNLHFRVPQGAGLLARVNPRDLADCLDNLLSNAVKYTPAGGCVTIGVAGGASAAEAIDAVPDAEVANGPVKSPGAAEADGLDARAAGLEPAPHYLAVYVRDTGIGIEPEALPAAGHPDFQGTIFEDFRRGKTALMAGVPGTGLGLAVVREVVGQAGGEIHVQSAPGQGSTFVVAFPAWRPPNA